MFAAIHAKFKGSVSTMRSSPRGVGRSCPTPPALQPRMQIPRTMTPATLLYIVNPPGLIFRPALTASLHAVPIHRIRRRPKFLQPPQCLTVPDSPQLEHKAWQHRIPGDGLRVIETRHWCLWTVSIDLFFYRVDQPAKLRAVVEILLHFS